MQGRIPYRAILIATFSLLLYPDCSRSQDSTFARKVIRKLASKQMHGRGYVCSGDVRAAKWISGEFRYWGLRPFGETYFQEFPMSINTIQGRTRLQMDGKRLIPGKEYLISASSPGTKGKFPIVEMMPDSSGSYGQFEGPSSAFVLTRGDNWPPGEADTPGTKGLLVLMDKDENLGWRLSGASRINSTPIILVRSDRLKEHPEEVALRFKNRYVEDHLALNVAAFVPGDPAVDSFVVVTAHYDHLGMMGKKVLFPGANDNASGTAMMMDLARYYAQAVNPPYYTMVFVALAAEEAGLLGSEYLAEHPLFPLDRVKFLVNLDMVGTGRDGITVVNGKVYNRAFNLVASINENHGYVKEVKARGEACNSDHCPFYRKGVPSFFIYTRGEDYKEYHNPADRAEDLPMTAYNGLFRLVHDFIESLPQEAYGEAISHTDTTGEHP